MRRSTSKNLSIKDVAKLAGVSISTVSRVLNKNPGVKKAHLASVQDAIKQLNYKPSVLAQRLATGKSNVIALVIPRYEGIFYSFYALELIRGIGTMAAALKLDLLLHISDDWSSLNLNGLGGVIFADIIKNRKQVEEALAGGIPTIVINNLVEDIGVNCIAIDNIGGAENAVNYLIGLGHRTIAHISGELFTQAAAHRFEGYKRALKKHGIPVNEDYIVTTDYSRGQARSAAEKLFKLAKPPTAIFVASDSMALEVMAVARERGIKIPADVSLVGFDDNPSGLYGPVALTTVRQPLVKMAQDSVKELSVIMNLGKKSPTRRIILPTELIIRESCQGLSPEKEK
jgi:LacI family transcriptional regulator